MRGAQHPPQILFPRTINEALEWANAEEEAVFWAGGTWLGNTALDNTRIRLPQVLISLQNIEELARASRSENNLEIGAMMSLNTLASIGEKSLPPALLRALEHIGTQALRYRATIGGHLALKNELGTLYPLLTLLETRVETRIFHSHGSRRKASASSRKLSLSQLHADQNLRKNELIIRIRIPTEKWDFSQYNKIQPQNGQQKPLIFAALARREKGVLRQWRMAFSDGNNRILRDRGLEISLVGHALPLIKWKIDSIDETILALTSSWEGREYEQETLRRLARGFLSNTSR